MASSAADIALASTLALSGTFMTPLPWGLVLPLLAATLGFAVMFDQIKLPIQWLFNVMGDRGARQTTTKGAQS
jgi:H+-transporting ATPase